MMPNIKGHEKAVEVFGRFDLIDFPVVQEIRFHQDSDGDHTRSNVDLILESDQRNKNYRIHLRLRQVRKFKIDGIGGGLLRIVGLCIDDVSQDGWENVAWHVRDYENGILSLYCGEVEVLSVDPV